MTIKASNFPTTRPTLNLDFAKTKQLDPRVTFSRASSGTYVDVNGVIQSATSGVARFDHNPTTGESLGLLVEEARTNSLQRSEYLDLVWTGSSFGNVSKNITIVPFSATAPDGTQRASKMVLNSGQSGDPLNAVLFRSAELVNQTVTLSLFVKFAGIDTIRLYLGNSQDVPEPNKATAIQYTFSSNTATLIPGNTGSSSTISNQVLSNGWVRLSLTRAAAQIWGSGGGTGGMWLSFTSAATGNGNDGCLIWGMQFEAGSFPTSYIPTPSIFQSRASTATYYDANGVIQTAASGVARSNAFFPDSNGVMRPAGLLLEAAGTNQVTYSQQIDSLTSTSYETVNFTANAAAAPDGTTTADLCVPTNVDGYHQFYLSPANLSGSVGTLSIFAKPNGYSKLMLNVGTSSNGFATFDLSGNGSLLYAGSEVVGYSIVKLANGWFRISTTNATFPNAYRYQIIMPSPSYTTGGPQPWTGNGTSGIYLWGIQFEAGSYPTSYIPTTTSTVTRAADVSSSATVTRSADVASITGANFSSWYRADQGTWLGAISKTPAGGRLVETRGPSAFEYSMSIRPGPTSVSFARLDSGSPSVAVTYPAKIAAAYNSLNIQGAANGTLASLLANGLHSNSTSVDIGRIASENTYLNAPISSLTYWPTRLSNATLQTLTR
jgi:hypothetical protein